MRRWLLFVFALLLLASGCLRKPKVETLSDTMQVFAQIYAVKDHQPDSALRLLQSASLDEATLRRQSKFLYAEYQLLTAELKYKNYQLGRNEEPVMETYRFYDSIHALKAYRNDEFLTFQYARATYFKAVIEERRDENQMQAFSDYLRSMWETDGLNRKRWVINFTGANFEYEHFTGLIYDRLAELLYNHDAWDLAIECLEESCKCFEKEHHWEGIASNFDLLGDIQLAQENRMGAVVYYERADSIYRLLDRDDDFLKFNAMLHRSITQSSMGDREGAKALLLEGLETSDRPWRTRRLHFGLGFIYYDLQEYDSSLFHYEQSYPLLPRQTAKAYCRIIELASMLGDSVKAATYGTMLADFYMDMVQHSGAKTRMMTLYENYKSQTKDERNKDVFFFIIMVVIALAFVIVFDSAFIHSRKKRHEREIARHEEIAASLEDEIESIRRVSSHREERIKDLESKLNKVISNPNFQSLPFDQKLKTLKEMPICKRAMSVKSANVKAGVAYPELVLSENQTASLVNAVDAVFPKFSFKIIEKYPRLKRSDVVYCCLYILGISEVQAAALTGKTYQAVWARSLKMHEIFDNKSNLQFVLNDFIKDWYSEVNE